MNIFFSYINVGLTIAFNAMWYITYHPPVDVCWLPLLYKFYAVSGYLRKRIRTRPSSYGGVIKFLHCFERFERRLFLVQFCVQHRAHRGCKAAMHWDVASSRHRARPNATKLRR